MFERIDPKDLQLNVFSAMGEQWMLVTAGTAERCNTMTASWGGLGVLWNLPMAIAYVRPQRYTRVFLDEQEFFTLTFFPEQFRKELALCGRTSGREVDKVAACGFTIREGAGGAPYFEEAELVLVCRKRMVMPMDPAAVPAEVDARHYDNDHHLIYWGEIVEVLQKV